MEVFSFCSFLTVTNAFATHSIGTHHGVWMINGVFFFVGLYQIVNKYQDVLLSVLQYISYWNLAIVMNHLAHVLFGGGKFKCYSFSKHFHKFTYLSKNALFLLLTSKYSSAIFFCNFLKRRLETGLYDEIRSLVS